jgi:hypothetical protein
MCIGNRVIFEYENEPMVSFKLWLLENTRSKPHLLRTFASRFCSAPMYMNFIKRADKISEYIYGLYDLEIDTITNRINDSVVRLALSNIEVLRGYLFNERVNYIQQLIEYLERQKTDIPKKYHIVVAVKEIDYIKDSEECTECFICYNEKSRKEYIELNCKHEFCGECIVSTIKNTKAETPVCPLCREAVSKVTLHDRAEETELSKYII